MKFSCEKCSAKYSIADEKVHGKILRIRCKKCGNIIEVRDPAVASSEPAHFQRPTVQSAAPGRSGGMDAEVDRAFGRMTAPPADEGDAEGDKTVLFDYARGKLGGVPPESPPPDRAPPSTTEWYLAIEGQQVGPLHLPEVKARLHKLGQGAPRTYAWRDGMKDWLKIPEVAELRGLLPGGPPPRPPLADRAAAERAAAEQAAAEAAERAAAAKKAVADQAAAEEAARLAAEHAAAAEAAAEAAEKIAAEETERAAAEQAAAEESAAAEAAAQEAAAAEKVAAEKARAEKAASEKAAAEKAAAEKAAAEKAAAEKAKADKLAAEKAKAEKLAAEKAAADKLKEDKAAAEKAAKDKSAADKAKGGKPGAEQEFEFPKGVPPPPPRRRGFPLGTAITVLVVLGAGVVLLLGALDIVYIPYISSERGSGERLAPTEAMAAAGSSAGQLLRRDPLLDRDAPRIVVQQVEVEKKATASQQTRRVKRDGAAVAEGSAAESGSAATKPAVPEKKAPEKASQPTPMTELERRVYGGAPGGPAPAVPEHLVARNNVPTAEAQGLSQETISRVIKRYRGGIQNCYQKQLKQDSSVRGRLTLSLKIGRDGRVISAGVEDSMKKTLIATCVTGIARGWRFPSSNGDIEVDYPLILEATH